MTTFDTDVVVIGAGPVGLTLANLIGVRGHRATVLEARHELIDYPRGVGLDDESIRTLRTAGLWERVRPFTVPHHVVRLVNGTGKVLATNNPRTEEFGYPRRHGFVQPLVDRELAAGLDQFMRHRTALRPPGRGPRRPRRPRHRHRRTARPRRRGRRHPHRHRAVRRRLRGRQLLHPQVDGGAVRGDSPSTRWVVVDVADDPIGTPSVYLGADPRRPYVSIGLPQGIRRWEFMLHDDEPTALCDDPAFMRALLARHVPDPAALRLINQRTFTHHGRVAAEFRKGGVFLVATPPT